MKAYVGGTFDLFHPGHIALLKWAKSVFRHVVVSLNRDEFVARYKGSPPVMTLDERSEVLQSCKLVDEVVVNVGDEDSKPAIQTVKPGVIVAGSDWNEAKLMRQMSLTGDFLIAMKAVLAFYPYSIPLHTEDIKRRVLK